MIFDVMGKKFFKPEINIGEHVVHMCQHKYI